MAQEHFRPPKPGVEGQLLSQARLTDARVSGEQMKGALAGERPLQSGLEGIDLLLAPYEGSPGQTLQVLHSWWCLRDPGL